MTAHDRIIARTLADEGLRFSNDLRDENRGYFASLPNSYFAIALAISLTWTKHALHDKKFITYAAGYIDGVLAFDDSIASNYCYRFGSDELKNALLNYRRYYKNVSGLMPNFYTCDVNHINRLQQRLLNRLNALRVNKTVTGIGPWLFTGPFKIILSDQDRLWNQDGINAIVLPTGMEVDRGINRLIREGYTFVRDFDPYWLEQETTSLLENYATYNMVHTFIANIGQIADTPAIHINSALYLYGRGDL
jgi:hypothetical protein